MPEICSRTPAFLESQHYSDSEDVPFTDVVSEEDYRRHYEDDEFFISGVSDICLAHGLSTETLKRERFGSNVVFGVDGAIIKVFNNLWAEDFVAERGALRCLSALPVPQILAEGSIGNWPYLILSVLDGIPSGDVWDRLQHQAKVDVLGQLGALVRRLHAQAPTPEIRNNWAVFIGERVEGAQAHHGMDEPWKSWLQSRLSQVIPHTETPVLLHADITSEHVLLVERDGSWSINGLIDFGDAKVGHAYYDFVAPIAELTFGEPNLTRVFLESYGVTLDRPTMEGITTLCLLHEFGTISDFLERHPAANPQAFHDALWSTEFDQ